MASRDGEGIFVRDDGTEIPKEILDETELFLDEVHDKCYKVSWLIHLILLNQEKSFKLALDHWMGYVNVGKCSFRDRTYFRLMISVTRWADRFMKYF